MFIRFCLVKSITERIILELKEKTTLILIFGRKKKMKMQNNVRTFNS